MQSADAFVASEISLACNTIPDAQSIDAVIAQIVAQMTVDHSAALSGKQKPRSHLSPIQKMPVDVITEIFIYCLPNDPNLKVSRPPLLLSHVCSDWREISISTPRLWSSLNLIFWGRLPRSTEMGIETWLTRASCCPLTLSLAGKADAISLLHCLMKFSEHWESVDISLPASYLDMFAPAKTRLPSLRHLTLDSSGWDARTVMVDAFQVAPQLQSLTLTRLTKHLIFRLPWRQLTKLIISRFKVVHILDFIRLSPNLVEFHADIPYGHGPRIAPSAIVTLNQLRKLELSHAVRERFNYILDYLQLPALRDLILSWPDSWCQSQILSLLSRSSCSLTKLCISGCALSPAEFIQILEHTPLLVEMDLSYCSFYYADDEIMKRLIYNADSDGEAPCLVRKLEILTIGDWFFRDLSLIADLIQSRWFFPNERTHDVQSDSSRLKPSCLSDVYLQVNQPRNENTMKEFVLPRLWRCQQQGLAFRTRLPGEIYDRCMEGA